MTTASTNLDLDAVGRQAPPYERTWTSRDAMLYAVGVGAGQEDPGVEQKVLPTFPVVLGLGGFPDMGKVSLAQILHAEQGVTLYADIPVEGRSRSVTTITGIFDKGKGGLVATETEVRNAEDDELLATLTGGVFVRGEGGWGGDRGPSLAWTAPDREPDAARTFKTSEGQALVYRLSGDRNPLHSDPEMARGAGFPRPILHGLCTYGYTGRALLDAVCDGDPSRFGSMDARFSMPVLPGQALTVSIWRSEDGALFRTTTEAGTVLDAGRFALRA
jgi:acyl dehydratase